MDPTTVASAVSVVRDTGLLGVTIFALVAGARGWYIWKWQHEQVVALYQKRLEENGERLEEVIKERDRWMATAIRGTILAERATEVHEEAYEVVRTGQDARRARPKPREGS